MIAYAKISWNQANKIGSKYVELVGNTEEDISNNLLYAKFKWGYTGCQLVTPSEYAEATGLDVSAEMLELEKAGKY